MKKCLWALFVLAGITSLSAQAQMKPEDAIKLRQSAMKLIGYNFGSVGAMVNDKKPYNKDEAIRNATRIEVLSSQPFEFFVAGTDKGETKAKAEIWKDTDKFRGLAEKFQAEAGKLAQVSRGGDMAALKTQFGATAQACKACHDDYREK
ncbi:MAG: cytochrome c [Betaproteobacteria bacterium]